MEMIKILLIALALFVAGCDKTNKNLVKNTDDQLENMLVKGKTTKAEVEEKFGKPNKINFDKNKREHWIYSHGEASKNPLNYIPITKLIAGQRGDIRNFIIIFEKDLVFDADATTKSGQVKGGLLTKSEVEK